MTSEVTLYTADRQWKVVVTAFKTYLVVYSSIGSEVRTYRWERQRRWYDPWYNHFHWVERPVDSIGISNTYEGLLPSRAPGAAHRTAYGQNRSHLEEKIWGVGIGVSVDASAGTGGPDWDTAGPGGMPSLDVREVRGRATVRIGGETLTAEVHKR